MKVYIQIMAIWKASFWWSATWKSTFWCQQFWRIQFDSRQLEFYILTVGNSEGYILIVVNLEYYILSVGNLEVYILMLTLWNSTFWQSAKCESAKWRRATFSGKRHSSTRLLQMFHSSTGWPDWANFSPIGWLFIFLKITEVAQFLDYFFSRKKLCINFDKNGLGYILGDFFTNSSGHAAHPALCGWRGANLIVRKQVSFYHCLLFY
jgi:hypothetical protein